MVSISCNCFKQTLTKVITLIAVLTFIILFFLSSANACINLVKGKAIQGGLIIFKAENASHIQIDGKAVSINQKNGFVVGFHKDDVDLRIITARCQDGTEFNLNLLPEQRTYKTQEINGLTNDMVTPPEKILHQIAHDSKMVKQARSQKGTSTDYFISGFDWPVDGAITGVYGSQRILNGKPRQPHFGIDLAAPAGTPITASAAGKIVMAKNLYFTGWTIIISHGDYLSSTYSHLQDIYIKLGEHVNRGEIIGAVGSTGRSTGPHLDWRLNWLDKRLDPQLIANKHP
tara:strand:+ start:198 stop:1058 length:861 start_codon:yes stop_codon:yes gene_type:complete